MLLESDGTPADSSARITGSTPWPIDARAAVLAESIALRLRYRLSGISDGSTARERPAGSADSGDRKPVQRMKIKTNNAIAKPVRPIA